MGQVFYVIKRKRQDGAQMVELEKSMNFMALRREDADAELARQPDREHLEIQELVAVMPPPAPPQEPPAPDPYYIPPGDVEAWAKVDAYIQGLTIPGSDLDPDWFGTNFTEDGLNVNCIINIEVPVSVYRPKT